MHVQKVLMYLGGMHFKHIYFPFLETAKLCLIEKDLNEHVDTYLHVSYYIDNKRKTKMSIRKSCLCVHYYFNVCKLVVTFLDIYCAQIIDVKSHFFER